MRHERKYFIALLVTGAGTRMRNTSDILLKSKLPHFFVNRDDPV